MLLADSRTCLSRAEESNANQVQSLTPYAQLSGKLQWSNNLYTWLYINCLIQVYAHAQVIDQQLKLTDQQVCQLPEYVGFEMTTCTHS